MSHLFSPLTIRSVKVASTGAGSSPNIRTQNELHDRYVQLRARTEVLIAPLGTEDMTVQSMPDTSPAKWHLAHTTWFFETFLLTEDLPDYQPFHPAFRNLFNSYYNA